MSGNVITDGLGIAKNELAVVWLEIGDERQQLPRFQSLDIQGATTPNIPLPTSLPTRSCTHDFCPFSTALRDCQSCRISSYPDWHETRRPARENRRQGRFPC